MFARNVGGDGWVTKVVIWCPHMICYGFDRFLVVLVCGASWWC